MTIETMKVVTDNKQGFKIINKDDFDPKVDKEFVEKTTTRKPRSTKKDK